MALLVRGIKESSRFNEIIVAVKLIVLGFFVLWLIQFIFPDTRAWIIWVYGAWALVETARLAKNIKQRNAFTVFLKLCKTHLSG